MPTFLERLSAQKFSAASSTALDVFVSGASVARVAIDAGGKMTWSSGSATGDATLYRSAANALKTDDTFEAALGVITLATDGAPSASLANGALAVDTTNHIFYYRSNSAWNQVSSGSSITVQDGAPSSPDAGDLWYESDTGKTLVYYADGSSNQWVELGTVPTYSTSVLLADTDNDTKIRVEESSDEDIIRFDTAGTERMTISAAGVVATVGDLTVGGNATIQSLNMDTIVAGDIIYGSGADTLARLAKGTDDQVLTLASGVPSWADAAGGGGTSIADADADTKIQVEESSDEDIIRFDVAGTQVATMTADGLLFGTDTASANAMDDYEEGLWTAAFTSGGGTVAPNASYDQMNYTKIGRVVHVSGNVDGFTVSSPTGSLTMTGLPFAIDDTAERSDRGCFVFNAHGLVSAEDNLFGEFHAGSGLLLNYGDGTTGGGGAHMATLIDAGTYLRISATYMAAT